MRLNRLGQGLRERMWFDSLPTVPDCACVQQLTHCPAALMTRQHHDCGIGRDLEDAARSPHAATLGHHDIDEGDVGLTSLGELDRLLTVSSYTNNLKLGPQ